MKEMVGGCCVCSDDRGWAENPLVYCDGQGCTVAVHQACYGIVTVPSGNWYCRKCESPDRAKSGPNKPYCELCPSKDGAIKKTDNNGWAHVVCALYIPEVRFVNVTTMEPIVLAQIPPERFNKVCYICEESGKGSRSTVGACMNCNKSGCKQWFHVTCAQAFGLLCEEAGNYLDNVKYCGYCQHHYSKLKKGANVKAVPAYRPLSADSPPSPDKESSDNWSKPGKRKLSTSAKSSSSNFSSSGKPSIGGKSSGTTSPAPTSAGESTATPTVEDPSPTPPPSVVPPATTDSPTTSVDSAVNGKFTTSNFVESVVTPSGSVFGDGKPGKKRKSQVKDESPSATAPSVNPLSGNSGPLAEDKRPKIDSSAIPGKLETPTPSVVVKVPTTAPSTSPSAAPPVPRQPVTTSPIAATSSIVVSVPLAVASLPTPPATTVPAAPTPVTDDAPGKRGRSQSADKSDKSKKQKRGGSATGSKRGGRSSQATPPPSSNQLPQPQPSPTPPVIATPTIATPAATPTPVVMPVSQAIKESPPSSPDNKQKHKKQSQSRDDKDKLFQNGVNAPHMLGNQLNPASTMAQKMSDTLNQELEAHSIFTSEPNLSSQPGQLVGPQLHSRVIASVRGSGAGTPQTSSTPPANAWAPSSTASTPQTLDQLLERQWEQGSQFLMEQAQHFDSKVASLLTCLHQLRAENLRLEENVNSLLQRRDHLLAVNARLAIPLVPPSIPPPTVNNIHPAAANVPVSMPMDGRPVNVPQPPRVNNTYPGGPVENGPTSPSQSYHPGQPNPISRHHSPGSTAQTYVCSAPGVVVRSTNITSNPEPRRSSSQSGSHPQSAYPMYSVAASQQQQIVMRRDHSDHHHPSSKPS
ncbi:protein AF-10-like isoform X1 [Macrosteles quadrilineatus]|uniref:protein AF-10-like isoform X1 n=1 Tax=Macrosteles quadrilineatus TaxID=74068 RepID=UPI0023E1EE3C|nr:protein AF-10-like isoform X1 [Macrosteles quadrilineatus]